MMFRFIAIVLIFLSIIMITYAVVQSNKKCENKTIEYRYLPRTLEEEQSQPVYVSDIFKTMFNEPSPWVNSVKNQAKMEKTFVSQY